MSEIELIIIEWLEENLADIKEDLRPRVERLMKNHPGFPFNKDVNRKIEQIAIGTIREKIIVEIIVLTPEDICSSINVVSVTNIMPDFWHWG